MRLIREEKGKRGLYNNLPLCPLTGEGTEIGEREGEKEKTKGDETGNEKKKKAIRIMDEVEVTVEV